MPQSGDDGIHVDDGASARPGAGSSIQAVQQRTAGIGNLFRVVKARSLLVIHPFQGHPGNVGTQDLLRKRIALDEHGQIVFNFGRSHGVSDHGDIQHACRRGRLEGERRQ